MSATPVGDDGRRLTSACHALDAWARQRFTLRRSSVHAPDAASSSASATQGSSIRQLSTQTAEERTARDDAEEFLRVELAHGPRAFKELAAAATSEGIAEKTLRRAKDALGVVSTKERGGQHGGWQWRLPDKVATTFQGENLGHLDHLDGNPLTEPDQDGQESQDGQKKHTGHLGAEGPSRNGWTAEAEERFIAKARQVFPGSHEEAA